ncbi:DinB family protein [Alicyclobacillus mali]|uniref:DinB family protein n=1 Tax=Alicyclobacillus mali (ex Roth et al. 2021) TaxID=1123961 RepID=A0ABS0F232_9BACL|nr:DinB family protein [Alicyclobacillus mali (ex Roth et al. 2021)]
MNESYTEGARVVNVLRQQYEWIRATRETLFVFLEQIPARHLHTALPGFGSGSIIRTHIHVADCYLYWLGRFGLGQNDFVFASEEEIIGSDVKRVRKRFDLVNETVERFVQVHDGQWDWTICCDVRWQEEPVKTTPLWLLTHAVTHEFHHKGQIVAMARHLGHVPPDTDLVLP